MPLTRRDKLGLAAGRTGVAVLGEQGGVAGVRREEDGSLLDLCSHCRRENGECRLRTDAAKLVTQQRD